MGSTGYEEFLLSELEHKLEEAERRLAELDRVLTNIRVHFEHLCSDEMRMHGFIAHEPDHSIDFQVFRALCGYKDALEEKAELVEAVRWERECSEMRKWLSIASCIDYRFDNREIVETHVCARAAVDALIGGENGS